MLRVTRRVRDLACAAGLFGCACLMRLGAGDDDHAPTKARAQAHVRLMSVSPKLVDSYIYAEHQTETGCREWLDACLRLKVNEIGKLFGLSQTQKDKLELAGKGDIDRFVRRVDELKGKWQPRRVPQAQFNAMARETWPLQQLLGHGLFESGSLFQKTLLTTLRPDQAAHYEQNDRERREYRNEAYVELVVIQLDAILGLSDDQRQRLLQLLLDKTRALRGSDQFGPRVVLAQMSRLPDDTFLSLFDPGQWRQLKLKLATARSTVATFKQLGLVFDDDLKTGDKP
jgi:hypothetical protein